MARSLFISYDGLTDPLGQSQILPYLIGLSRKGHKIHILSCEKKDRWKKNRETIEAICSKNEIGWTPLPFHRTPPVLAKYYDLFKLMKAAIRLHHLMSFDLIHCRSYLAADIGRKLQKKTGVRFLFDMRSFWVDERIDGGLWDTNHFFYRKAYQVWKQKEARLIADADHIISLTEAGKKEIVSWACYTGQPITVIPCSADLDLFSPSDVGQKSQAKLQLQLSTDTFVLSYLGSLGTWYLLDEMLFLFKLARKIHKDAKFLLLTPDDPEEVYTRLPKFGLKKEDMIIRFAQRSEVPGLLKASDVSVSFIKPAYSKIGSSPTKLGELLAIGIPVICNDIGDVGKIINETNGGVIVFGFDRSALQPAIDYIKSLPGSDHMNREKVTEYYSLNAAVDKYNNVYEALSSLPIKKVDSQMKTIA